MEVDFAQADDLGVACTVVLGKASDVAFDVGAEGEIGLCRRGGEIVDLCVVEQGVVGDEDRAMAVGSGFGVAGLLPERAALALAGEEAVVEAIGAASAIGACRCDAVGAGESVGAEGEVSGCKTGVTLTIVNLACDELGLAVLGSADIGDVLGRACGAGIDEALRGKAELFQVTGDGGCNGGAIGSCAGIGLDAAHKIGGGQHVGVVPDDDRFAMFADSSVGAATEGRWQCGR